MHRLTRREARRLAIRAQLLDVPRPTDLLATVQQLTMLQIDPTAAVAPNVDLVSWTRLGSSYRPSHLRDARERDRSMFEMRAYVRPMSDLPLYLADGENATHPDVRPWLAANDRFRRDVLARLADAGPLLSRDIPDTSAVSWASTGWTNNRNVTLMLELLNIRGEVAIAGRRGAQRVWDLPERVCPRDLPSVPPDEARLRRERRRLRSLGIMRPGDPELGEPAEVEGVAGTWRVDPEQLDRPFTGRTALLSPFDRLVHDRVRAADLFGFEYLLEMYKPKAARRWGYFALPVLYGDRLVGKVDATANRKAGVLTVHAVHEDVPFTKAMSAAVGRELRDLASWQGLDLLAAP